MIEFEVLFFDELILVFDLILILIIEELIYDFKIKYIVVIVIYNM